MRAIEMAELCRLCGQEPTQLCCSLTWDRGKELSDHVRFSTESGVKVFFAAPPQSVAARHKWEHEWVCCGSTF